MPDRQRRRTVTLLAAALLGVVLAPPGRAADETPPGGGFSLPIDCTPGRDCWPINYPDMDAGAAARDPWCGPRSYDGHKGTDIAVRDRAAMRRGVDVLAAADGRVLRLRDSMADGVWDRTAPVSEGRDCGNGMVIDHGGGWQTQYCHLRRGSLRVRPGETVRRGQPVGLVGLSGKTEFPHVHITVRRDGAPWDPGTGRALIAGCDGAGGRSLWTRAHPLRYSAGDLYAAGFAAGAVTGDRIKDDASSPPRLARDAPALVLWAAVFGVRPGDQIRFEITGPDGKVIARHAARADRDQAWRLAFAGRKRPGAAWPAGRYDGRVVLMRQGKAIQDRKVTVTLE